ncbi:class I SAM-dependent methyltransferase [Lysinibacillus sp. NPDC048646]|uniref:class I SAM-dependent methyltransferase n=1 Tax=Lysinibacillus sp. NPDC048646 TaxID=3390574 RepID=UPI003D070BD5
MEYNENKIYWDEFYRKEELYGPSSFCNLVKCSFGLEYLIIDIGCGTGRDSRAFLENKYEVRGIDSSEVVITKNNEYSLKQYSKEVYFSIDVSCVKDFSSLINSIKKIAEMQNKKILIYSRFFLHAINDDTERVFLDTLEVYLEKGDCIALEFRTIEDKQTTKIYDNHYRRYIDTNKFEQNLKKYNCFEVSFFQKGTGMSLYKTEDPYLARYFIDVR